MTHKSFSPIKIPFRYVWRHKILDMESQVVSDLVFPQKVWLLRWTILQITSTQVDFISTAQNHISRCLSGLYNLFRVRHPLSFIQVKKNHPKKSLSLTGIHVDYVVFVPYWKKIQYSFHFNSLIAGYKMPPTSFESVCTGGGASRLHTLAWSNDGFMSVSKWNLTHVPFNSLRVAQIMVHWTKHISFCLNHLTVCLL